MQPTETNYQLDHFVDAESEVDRLRRQAALVLEREMACWDQLRVPRIGNALDVGCGPGVAAEAVMSQRPGLRYRGVDQDAQAVAEARTRMSALVAAAEQLPFDDGAFDLASTRLLLRHVPDPLQVAREMARVVRPGGTVLLVDTDDQTLIVEGMGENATRLFEARQALIRESGADAFIGRRLRRLAVQAGLTDVRADVLTLSSELVGRAAFREIVLRPHETAAGFGRIDASLRERTSRELDAWVDDPGAFAMVSLVLVAGTR